MIMSEWSNGTIFYYFIVILLAIITAFLSYKQNQRTINIFGMIITFLLLWQLLALSSCGIDYDTYNMLFINADKLDYIVGYHRIEIGFALLNYFIHFFTQNINIYNAILSFIFLFLTMVTLYKLRYKIHFGWAILAFTCIFYLQFMNVKRIYLAASICFYGIYYLLSNKKIRYFFIITLASLFHTSAIIMYIPLLFDYFKKINKKTLILLSIMTFLVLFYFRDSIASLNISDRYQNYGLREGTLGWLQICYHIPIIYIIYKTKYQLANDKTINYSYLLILLSFIICNLGYFIEVVGRMFVYFMLPYFVGPSNLDLIKFNTNLKIGSRVYKINMLLKYFMFFYFILRLFIYMSNNLYIDGIMPYKNIFGTTI